RIAKILPILLASMTLGVRQILRILKSATMGWLDDRSPSMGEAIDYCAAFSLVPLLILIIAIASLFFSHEAAQGAIIAEVGGLIGRDTAAALQNLIVSVSEMKS